MIRCNLSTLMGERKLRISQLARETGLPRSTITILFDDEAQRITLDTIDALCDYFECGVGDLFEHVLEEQ